LYPQVPDEASGSPRVPPSSSPLASGVNAPESPPELLLLLGPESRGPPLELVEPLELPEPLEVDDPS
jgi:hypothetical protein